MYLIASNHRVGEHIRRGFDWTRVRRFTLPLFGAWSRYCGRLNHLRRCLANKACQSTRVKP
jgi:hypothetical protein